MLEEPSYKPHHATLFTYERPQRHPESDQSQLVGQARFAPRVLAPYLSAEILLFEENGVSYGK